MVDARRPGVAFSLGGMGSASTNFYNQAYARQGFADVARRGAGALWSTATAPDAAALSPRRDGARHDADRHRADGPRPARRSGDDVGVTTARLYPAGDTLDERLDTLGRALEHI